MANLKFNLDLPLGKKGEMVISDLFYQKYNLKTTSFNDNNKFDFNCVIKNKNYTVEVKTDVWCIPSKIIKMKFGDVLVEGRDSGNIFIETECRGKLSGINVSQSDIFVYYYPLLKQAWIIKTKKLKKLIQNNDFEFKENNVGDEGSNTKGYVIPREKYSEHFKIIDVEFEWPY